MTEFVATANRTAKLGAMIASYLGKSSTASALIKDREDRLRFLTTNLTGYCQTALKYMNFTVETKGREKLTKKNYLYVSNHMSYLDILVFSSQVPSVFVTSVDMGQVFLLGKLAELGGSIFVERRNRSQVDKDLNVVTDTLKQGFNIALYPEGTSTNGQVLLPFKKTLFMSAVESGVDIAPVALKYVEIDGEPFSAANADKVCWHGDMTFADHFLGVMALKNVKVMLEFQDPISTEGHIGNATSRTMLAEKAWSSVQEAYFEGRPEGFGKKRAKMTL